MNRSISRLLDECIQERAESLEPEKHEDVRLVGGLLQECLNGYGCSLVAGEMSRR